MPHVAPGAERIPAICNAIAMPALEGPLLRGSRCCKALPPGGNFLPAGLRILAAGDRRRFEFL